MSDLFEILYCSVLAPDQSPAIVGNIVTRARMRNAQRDITGLLVFDGQGFCQHFEGPRAQVLDLMDALSNDPRHEQVRVVYDGPLAQRRYRRFEMGFAETEDSDEMARVHEVDGVEALERFLALRPRFDISG